MGRLKKNSPLLFAWILLLEVGAICSVANGVTVNITGSQITGIRLTGSSSLPDRGRVEVQYNNTWGTICDDFWYTSDAQVACRMLGYQGAICSTSNARFGAATFSVPIWMDNLHCSGSEAALDLCRFNGWGNHNCRHSDDAGVVCSNDVVGVPYNIMLLNATTRSMTIGWTNPTVNISGTVSGYSFTVSYTEVSTNYASSRTYSAISYVAGDTYNVTIGSLSRNTEYSVRVRVYARYQNSDCGSYYWYYYYVYGNYSDNFIFRTRANLSRPSNISVRLISPTVGASYLGRVEVYYNSEWGTVCDDYFYSDEADVICGMLNYTRGALCYVSRARLGRGRGRIWLDNLNCGPSDEIIEDCTHRGWGVTSGCDHFDDVGVICHPNEEYGPVQNLTVVSVGPNYATLRWNVYRFPTNAYSTRYQFTYVDESGYSRRNTVYGSYYTQYNLRYLQYEMTYNITIRAQIRLSSYCSAYVYGQASNQVTIRTMETPPTSPPTLFHVTVINTTSIEAEWELPPYSSRNGIIRGYKLFWRPAALGGVETTIDIPDNTTDTYVLTGLQRSTAYIISVLAYTVGDGPRTIHLTAITYEYDPLISSFGIDGNGRIKETRYSYSYRYGRVNIHCGVSNPSNVTIGWYFVNGTQIGSVDRNFRSGYYTNGTAILQIANSRPLSDCDGGVYTCIVNASRTVGRVEKRNFTLVIDYSPPRPRRPTLLNVKSNSITIGWNRPICDGGHVWNSVTIRYNDGGSYYYSYTYIRNIDSNLRNYTITGLLPNVEYTFSIQITTKAELTSSYSLTTTATTLPPAPSPPTNVYAILITTQIVEVHWRVPAVPSAVITHYTVYATPLVYSGGTTTARGRRQVEQTSTTDNIPQRVVKVFPSTASAGNITLNAHSVTYHFQVSASAAVNSMTNEGELSPITPNATLYIPEPGLPTPINVNIVGGETTNTSVILTWDYPPPPVDIIEQFLITYTSNFEWRSVIGNLFQLEHSGEIYVDTNRVKVSPLVPGARYQFRVSAITSKGVGAEVIVFGGTVPAATPQASVAHFQLLIGPIDDCIRFKNNVAAQLLNVRAAVTRELIHLCPFCELTNRSIIKDEFSCRGDLTKQITYRARIIGTDVYSAPDLVSILNDDVKSGRASLVVERSRLHLDPSCSTALESLKAPDCIPTPQIGATTKANSGSVSKITNSASAGEIGGIIIGVVIAVLIAALILVLLVALVKKWTHKDKSDQFRHHTMNEVMSPFGDSESNQNIGFDEEDVKTKVTVGDKTL